MDDYPAKDYTVRVYSKQDLTVLDSSGNNIMLHMDGKSPSGFKIAGDSGDAGGDDGGDAGGEETSDERSFSEDGKYTGPPEKAESLIELFQSTDDFTTIVTVIFNNPLLMFILFKFW
mmetsp:Transcript_214/g.382  ORF Transcript_214/g.382 Transcript_214/m.382 type:complete len:117 (+) Transcript_214:1602-1952(+)